MVAFLKKNDVLSLCLKEYLHDVHKTETLLLFFFFLTKTSLAVCKILLQYAYIKVIGVCNTSAPKCKYCLMSKHKKDISGLIVCCVQKIAVVLW